VNGKPFGSRSAFKPFGNHLTVFGFQFLHIPGVICASRTFGEWSVEAVLCVPPTSCNLLWPALWSATIAMHFCRAKMGGKNTT